MKLNTMDHRIINIHLELDRPDLENLPAAALPEGYRFVFYQPGDETHWIAIERAAGEFDSDEKGWAKWNHYFAPYVDELPHRMVFIENAEGRKIATASAHFDVRGLDDRSVGYLHWVAVHPDEQGRGLSRPLVYHVLMLLKGMGHTYTKILTQTCSWVAVRLYLSFGFRPEKQNAAEAYEGWRIVRTLNNAPALSDYPPLPFDDCLVK